MYFLFFLLYRFLLLVFLVEIGSSPVPVEGICRAFRGFLGVFEKI